MNDKDFTGMLVVATHPDFFPSDGDLLPVYSKESIMEFCVIPAEEDVCEVTTCSMIDSDYLWTDAAEFLFPEFGIN